MKIKKACCAVAVAAAVAAGVSLWMRHDPDEGYCVRMRLNSARERTETIDGIRWHYGIVDGKALIVKAVRRGSGPFSDKLTLPAELGGCPVRAVCGSVFRQDDPVRSLTIPEGVTKIFENTFAGVKLESVSIPASVTNISSNAVSSKTIKEYVVSPDNPKFCAINKMILTKDGEELVCGVSGDVKIPEGVKRIPGWAFSNTTVTSVEIPVGLESLGDGAFDDCTELKSVSISPGVKVIPAFAFQGCLSLERVDLPPGVTNINAYAFEGCKSLKSIVIPEGVVQLEHHSFANCANLESVTIPSTVKYIACHAFSACSRKLKVTANIRDAKISIGAFSAVNDLSEYRGVNRKGFERDGEGRLTFDGKVLNGH